MLAVLIVRSVALSLLIEWECRRAIRPDETPPEVRPRLAERERETDGVRDA